MDRLPSTRLRAACRKTQSLGNVKRIIERYGADPEHRQHLLVSADPATRMTALASAAEEDNIEVTYHWLSRAVVEYLLAVGADQTAISRDVDNNTVLHVAARIGSPLIIEAYYTHFAFVLDWANTLGCTPLHTAAQAGQYEATKMLLELGADVDLADFAGDAPLHVAAAWGHGDIARLLILRGAVYSAKNDKGWTPADYAFSYEIISDLSDAITTVVDAAKQQERARRKRAKASRSAQPIDTDVAANAVSDEMVTPVGLGFNVPRSGSTSPGSTRGPSSPSPRTTRDQLYLQPVSGSPSQGPSSPSSPNLDPASRTVIANIAARDTEAIAAFRDSPRIASGASSPSPSRSFQAPTASERGSPKPNRTRSTSENSILSTRSLPAPLSTGSPSRGQMLGSVAPRRARAPT